MESYALTRAKETETTAFDTMPLCVFRLDTTGIITYANRKLLEQLQTTPENIIGKEVYDFYPKALREQYRCADQEMLRKGQMVHAVEQNRNPKTGEIYWVEVYKTPLIDENGITGIQKVFWDVSERFLVEQEHPQRQALLETLTQYSPDVVMLTDEQLCITYANRALNGLNDADMQRGYIPDLLPNINPTEPSSSSLLLKTLIYGNPCRWQTSYRNDKGTFFLELRAVRMIEEDASHQLQITATDITQRIEDDQKLQLAAAVYTAAKEAILITDPNGIIIDANQSFTEISGYLKTECCGAHFHSYLFTDSQDTLLDIKKNLETKDTWQGELYIGNKQQFELTASTSISVIRNQCNAVQNHVILFSDITRQKQHQQQLEQIALFDPLTNLPNRYALSMEMDRAMEIAQSKNQRLAVIYLDVEGFKSINERHGHSQGDRLMAKLAHQLTKTIHPGDTIARIGGDEFVILAPNINARSNLEQYYYQILDVTSLPIANNAGVLELSANMGITFYPQPTPIKADALLRQADLAMYQSRTQGKNRYAIFNLINSEYLQEIDSDVKALEEAIANNQLTLYYQPKVNMRLGRMVGAEALLRWRHPTKGLLTPDSFLMIATDSPLAIKLDHWVLRNAILQLQQWQIDQPDIQLSVNINIKTLEQAEFAFFINDLITACKVTPQNITLEIKESSAIEDIKLVTRALHSCLDTGIRFSLDHFGIGHSTLKFLRSIPANELKIDRSLIKDMLENSDDMAVIEGAQGLAKAFNKSLVAEGVETEAHGFALLSMGCDLAQGFAIAKPMPGDKLITWQRTWSPCPSWLM